ncbi:hypothetical protein PMU66_02645 [Enterococcus durans]|uniref:hypothetical protein n=1 Tax=Enterococcus durans TaxID=53345 RepID=UPI00232D95AD|nr:hypothetical protein [Enterococcus durans]MDB1652573.1 hypothetical protein [Enterococcus durans]MDB1656165.1 hypothetical protein [Enterococcus durans]MDB1662999.1 hypothetical protein [Enterococcus durans]MDB1668143.1 hypothetical protein [Enterococcus durans]MDB1670978.1 hypothetical protein [Enterococcus durans]
MFDKLKALFRIGGAKIGMVETLNSITDHPKIAMSDSELRRIRNNKEIYKNVYPDVEYINSDGYHESINNAPQSFSAGRTSISNASRYNPSGENESKPLVSEDIYIYLEGTGLLYRGVPPW